MTASAVVMADGWAVWPTPEVLVGPGERIDDLRDAEWCEEMIRRGRAVRVPECEAV